MDNELADRENASRLGKELHNIILLITEVPPLLGIATLALYSMIYLDLEPVDNGSQSRNQRPIRSPRGL